MALALHHNEKVQCNLLSFAAAAFIALFSFSCSEVSRDGPNPENNFLDFDGDGASDQSEDRNQNGQVDSGETDPNRTDTDGDGIVDGQEVSFLACGKSNDRPFAVVDLPGASSQILLDSAVSERSVLRTPGNQAPGAMLYDPQLSVAAVLVSKSPASGVTSAAQQRAHEVSDLIEGTGQILSQGTRGFQTYEGFDAEHASFRLKLSEDRDVKRFVRSLAEAWVSGTSVTGLLPEGGPSGRDLHLELLTVYRSPSRVVLVATAIVSAAPLSAQLIRSSELVDGTNVSIRGAFTRHVCDELVANRQAKADILWVVDDSGSMGDDQAAVRDAASAMATILQAANVDFRLAVARTFAQEENDRSQEGQLEGNGFTSDLEVFKQSVVVDVGGGWEPGLDTGISALDRALPATASGAPVQAARLREDAARIVIHLSDERDQTVECAACGTCEAEEGEALLCTEPAGDAVVQQFIQDYQSRNATSFALVGDFPAGCEQMNGEGKFEPGQGYIEVAEATGGRFGSLCGDMTQNLEDVARAATGVASAFSLSHRPASATLKVAVGLPGKGKVVARDRDNGFDYDPASNAIVFFGSAQPELGEEVTIGYRRWVIAGGDADTAGDPCNTCPESLVCDPELDIAECGAPCGEEQCSSEEVCLEEQATCVPPFDSPTNSCGCTGGLVCDESSGDCLVPCEISGCPGAVCNQSTHLCESFSF